MVLKEKTLQARWPVGRTLILALTLIAVSFLAASGLVSLPSVKRSLPMPSVGGGGIYFEEFINQIDEQQAMYGRLDCLLVGSSVVYEGIDVPAFEEAYRAGTGQVIHCAKLSIQALQASFIGDFADFLIKVYHPRLFIYVSSIRDYQGFADVTQDKGAERIVTIPWYQYRQGQFNVQGWLVDHSTVFRYYLAARNWMKPPAVKRQLIIVNVGQPLQAWEGPIKNGFANFEVNQAALSGIDKLASLKTTETQTLMVQIPLHPSFVLYLPHRQKDADQSVQIVEREALAHQLPYWRAENVPAIPNNLWYDRIHMLPQGGAIYSQWLGERTAAGVQRGEIPDPTRPYKMEK